MIEMYFLSGRHILKNFVSPLPFASGGIDASCLNSFDCLFFYKMFGVGCGGECFAMKIEIVVHFMPPH